MPSDDRAIAICASLGAGFWRVPRVLLAESLVLALLGSGAGVAVPRRALRYLFERHQGDAHRPAPHPAHNAVLARQGLDAATTPGDLADPLCTGGASYDQNRRTRADDRPTRPLYYKRMLLVYDRIHYLLPSKTVDFPPQCVVRNEDIGGARQSIWLREFRRVGVSHPRSLLELSKA